MWSPFPLPLFSSPLGLTGKRAETTCNGFVFMPFPSSISNKTPYTCARGCQPGKRRFKEYAISTMICCQKSARKMVSSFGKKIRLGRRSNQGTTLMSLAWFLPAAVALAASRLRQACLHRQHLPHTDDQLMEVKRQIECSWKETPAMFSAQVARHQWNGQKLTNASDQIRSFA